MIKYYRLLASRHAGNLFAYGPGGGRWNPRGVPMIYAGATIALITTEFLSIKGGAVVNDSWSLVTYQLEIDPPQLNAATLRSGWDSRPYPIATQSYGQRWTQSNESVCLKVPSARIPLGAYPIEHNLLINPLHPDLRAEVKVMKVEDFTFQLNEWAS